MIKITPAIIIDEKEIQEEFIRASGPGGQHINKASTAVQLRFDAAHSTALPDDVRRRLIKLAGKKMTEEGVIVITARRFRTQERNRRDAIIRLTALIRRAAEKPKPRRETRPPRALNEQRLEEKRRRSVIKRRRRPVSTTED